MEKKLIKKGDFDLLHAAFCHAFSGYKVDLNPSKEEFDFRLHQKLNIDYELSAGAFDGESMVGFILHTSNLYEGIPTAFNGGTGVIPGFRNQKTGEELYEFLLPKIIAKSLARVILEVIDTNQTAIRLYEKIGFSYRRKFLCYKLEKPAPMSSQRLVVEGSLKDINDDFADFEPSFIDSKNQLLRGVERTLIVKKEDQLAGYLVFQPKKGRISQLAVSRLFRQEGIASALISAAQEIAEKKLTIINVPEDAIGFQDFLVKSGFENQVNQFEMELII